MKKTFLAKPDTHRRVWQAKRNALLTSSGLSWGAYALLFVILLLLVRLVAPNFFFSQLATPAFQLSDTLAGGSQSFFASFGDASVLALRAARLADENAALAAENRTLLARLDDISALASLPGVVAGVVARPPASPYDTLLVAVGSERGITLDMEAFGPGGVPLGAVSDVTRSFSRVALLSAPGAVTLGWVGDEKLAVTLRGEGAGALSAVVARTAPIAVGDAVYVPGPGALAIGLVARIDSDPAQPGVTLRVQSALNLFSITWVELRETGASYLRAGLAATSTLP